jgi:hypothetical protein
VKHFSPSGICLFGKLHRGKHATDIPAGWRQWACDNVSGFKEAFEVALSTNKPQLQPEPLRTHSGTTGRKYILHAVKRRYQP